MLIQTGSVVTGLSGSLGGITASRNANSAYFRKKVKNTNPNTTAQQTRRNQFGSTSRAWKSLTVAEQNSWITAAANFPYKNRLNISSTYTGAQLYSKFNNQLIAVGLDPITTAPTGVSFNSYEIQSATVNGTPKVFKVTIQDTTLGVDTVPTGFHMVIMATRGLSKGVTRPKKPMFKIVTTLAETVSMTNVDITAAYTTLFGAPDPTKNNIFVQCYLVSVASGQVAKKVIMLATV